MKRKTFLKTATLSIPSFYVFPRHVLGGKDYTAPSDTLNIASVGAGGMCRNYIDSCNSENIVALCDVDDERAKETYEAYPNANRYRDFRVMFEKEEENIDAVIVGTPDHTHTIPAIMALKMKKHLYCAKPLTRTIYESRKLLEASREAGVATQMSTQSNASEDHRVLAEMIWSGVIGEVREVHTWSNRPIWPQGLKRPEESVAPPETLDWDLWLGPAPKRPYNPAYVPFDWRGWHDFGTGALGDMGCHHFDAIARALKLTQPEKIYASSTRLYEETYPDGSIVHYEFPRRADMPPVEVTWYDGGLKPPRPDELGINEPFSEPIGGILFVGSKGKILTNAVGLEPKLLPLEKNVEYTPPKPILPRSPGHYQEWIDAAKGGDPAGANFEYGCPITELVLLGNIAIRTQNVLEWDYEEMRITNFEEANGYLREEYHNGWSLDAL